jgi:hypothetical protein
MYGGVYHVLIHAFRLAALAGGNTSVAGDLHVLLPRKP